MKKGQAAMEFLMTYGWAILVVIAAIAALAYFGVLSPDKMLPERTTFQAPVPSIDNAVTLAGIANAGTVTIPFKNNVGFSITINNVTGATGTDCGGVSATTDPQISVAGAAFVDIADQSVTNGQDFRIRVYCTTALVAGEKFDSDITIQYTNTESNQVHYHMGSVSGKIVTGG